MDSCLFCSIVRKEKEADIVSEDSDIVVFTDIRPSAPVHLLIVPRKHIVSVSELEDGDAPLVGKLFLKARDVAREKHIDGYKLLFNVGRKGGQLIDHIHLHLMGGWDKAEPHK
ncbi:MAG: histidine triad nucleotide-binding protein [Candidatus Niyogibacteria bacterium CG10_big_fil_rev_8_21_14_0_10_46_36]|uniref:Histidine triad nucleotide-binding protein n=1 Tax=Candidatus Niyogibacteria bacterium CG10_big_fil_rev_8_21_14_0_10_46_36 TaxID=1974726 RepID=A0A2H0TFR8_9BACT|nr:MAG: histidine triad nucleotide-binding protein [Candidatus Niyogibacteria bacterium CG10_big_fil_rev_8_21_14_0_10_46_36]